jgi:TM2 domain-containing membrane protein YozV
MNENPYRPPETFPESPENGPRVNIVTTNARLVLPSVPPKSPVLMFVLSLVLVGLGQVILGQTRKGIAIFVGCGTVGILTTGSVILLGPIFGVAFGVDAYMVANKLKRGTPVGRWEFF